MAVATTRCVRAATLALAASCAGVQAADACGCADVADPAAGRAPAPDLDEFGFVRRRSSASVNPRQRFTGWVACSRFGIIVR